MRGLLENLFRETSLRKQCSSRFYHSFYIFIRRLFNFYSMLNSNCWKNITVLSETIFKLLTAYFFDVIKDDGADIMFIRLFI